MSNLPYEWRSLVDEIFSMKMRTEFGITIHDKDLNERQRLAVECFQQAYNKKRNAAA